MSTRRGPSTSVQEFAKILKEIHARKGRVLALCGAGLSAASGLGTFRGAGGMWRKYKATSLATREAFEVDPGLVWLFYSYRRHKALQAKPNPAHYALAELAKNMDDFLCLTQNVDGLSQRANHPPEQLKLLHGSLFDIKCFNKSCTYFEKDNYNDPFHPVLAITEEDDRLADANKSQSTAQVQAGSEADKPISPSLLPHCPSCSSGLLRPGVVWFGESLPKDTISSVDAWIDEGRIDIMFVIGTTAQVYPAAGYVNIARQKGARIVVVNVESKEGELGAAGYLGTRDFLFQGDAGVLLPMILEGVIGNRKDEEEK